MKGRKWLVLISMILLCETWGMAAPRSTVEKTKVDPSDPTARLYQSLNKNYAGQLKDFFVLADIVKDSQNPPQEFQHVLRVEYDQQKSFGRFRIYVRRVARLTPEQLKTYSPEQVYNFAFEDEEKFEKIEPGPFGLTGDLYFHVRPEMPLHTAPVTDEVRKQYQLYVNDYILPAVEKR